MKTKILILLLLVTGCATQKTAKAPQTERFGETVVLDHTYFKIVYNTDRRLAEYVSYELTKEKLGSKIAERANKFKIDPMLMEQNLPFVAPSEYVRTGYDRGHLAPSGDFTWDQSVNDTTFVMSNMVPQSPNLNRDSWRRLEDQVRKWACGEGKILVITGPVLSKNLPKMKSGLEIPQKFFKIIIDETPPKKSISFVYDQSDRGDKMLANMVPVNNVEVLTGIAFNESFPDLNDNKVRLPASVNDWKEADCDK